MGEMYETPNKKFKVSTISVITYADYVIRTFIVKHVRSLKQDNCIVFQSLLLYFTLVMLVLINSSI